MLDACYSLGMAYRSQADWDSVDWSCSDRGIAAQLGVSHGAVAKRRRRIGHASDYTVDTILLRGWFERHRTRLSQMTKRDIQVTVYDDLEIVLQKPQVAYWRKLMNLRVDAEDTRPESVAAV